jgi:hypothetical protein
MLESIVSFSLLLLLASLAVEATRLAAVHVVLTTAVEESLSVLATRWVHLQGARLVRPGSSNAPDLAPPLAEALENDILGHVGSFPGFSPRGMRGSERPSGRLFVDLEGATLSVEVHVCVPAFFLPWSPPQHGPGKGRSPNSGRDCQGRFSALAPHFSWALRARSSMSLPANVALFNQGLALPVQVPLVSFPNPSLGPFVVPGAGRPFPWTSLFEESVNLFRENWAPANRPGIEP